MVVKFNDIISAVENAGISVDVTDINGSDSLSEAGVDSLEMMSFFLAIEEKFNVKFPDEDIDSLDTIDGIISYMARF